MFVLMKGNTTELLRVCQTKKKHQSVCITRMWGFYLDGIWLWRIGGGIMSLLNWSLYSLN